VPYLDVGAVPTPPEAFAPQSSSTGGPVRAYGLAVVATAASIALTRFTWPFFAGAPFAPLFAAVAAASHFGGEPAGLLAVVLAVAGASLAFPSHGPVPWVPQTLIGFVPVALIGSHIIAARNRAVAALRGSEAQLRATWEHATLGAALLNRFGQVERMNPALERLLGYSGLPPVGLSFVDFSHPDDADGDRQRLTDFIAGADAFYQRDQRFRRKDGSLFWGRVTVSVIGGADGARTGALAVLEDMTAQRQAELDLRASEERLRRAQKMEAVGQLVAGIAHNFNNLLTVTMGYTDILLDRERDDQDREAVQEIRKATDRGAALTRQLLAFGRKHDARPARIDLNRTVAGLREMLTGVIREDIELTIEVADGPAPVVIDPHDLEQVVLNLVINARDALPGGGAIHIDVARERVDAANGPDAAVAPGEYVRLRVRDNGIGMPPDVQAHLFEPFFTTKEVGEGTGLGLAFVHGIARHGRGFVTVESAPGKGTTVSVYLPPSAGDPARPAIDAPPVSSPEGLPPATILLVEDEDAVRSMSAQMLSRAGYRVLSAATPAEARALFEQHADDIDLLVTDVIMPEMHGPALAEQLVARRPDLPVLFVSGYSDAMPASAAASGRVTFLAKPFASSRLVSAVADLLTARTP
jgi:two-component system, cell cycle sensor histidine kinase and response regulator CckA